MVNVAYILTTVHKMNENKCMSVATTIVQPISLIRTLKVTRLNQAKEENWSLMEMNRINSRIVKIR